MRMRRRWSERIEDVEVGVLVYGYIDWIVMMMIIIFVVDDVVLSVILEERWVYIIIYIFVFVWFVKMLMFLR